MAEFPGVFDLFKIGIGPSSSHTMGPMLAAHDFVAWVGARPSCAGADRITCELFGSLSATGKGHGTDLAVTLGLAGLLPDRIGRSEIETFRRSAETGVELALGFSRPVRFVSARDIVFSKAKPHPRHPNTLTCRLFEGSRELAARTYFSVGGGFIETEAEPSGDDIGAVPAPYPFATSAELIALTDQTGLDIAALVLANESSRADPVAIHAHLDLVWQTMQDCVSEGMEQEGCLPGPMQVRRRAAAIRRKLEQSAGGVGNRHTDEVEWVSLWAIAANETNASFGRVVTAPTNGAAGVIPAVLLYCHRFVSGMSDQGTKTFLLTATAFGSLLKRNASISGADVGCQGEVGSAAAMAAAGLTACLGGTPRQIENAAEIALEHHLGMTCDPIGGLVQIPCIERNALAANKAISAARLALLGDGNHYVSFDQVVRTMMQTGRDMKRKYKETSKGGLAVNVPLC